MEGEPEPEATLFPATVGEKLRAAREAQGVSLADIATSTRIPQRHLEAIEKSNYASLPSITYALGFAKAYARAVEVDEVAIARELRGELSTTYEPRAAPAPVYDLDGPTRRAPGGLVWISLLVVVLLVAGIGIYYGTPWFRGSAPEAESLALPEDTPTPDLTNQAIADATAGGGQVSLIALGTVWLRVTDGTGKTLFEKELKAGERYDVPADADHPRARVPRPDLIQVTLNGSNVAPLGDGAQTVDVEVSADALAARGQPGATPSPAPTSATTPTTRPRPRPTPSATPAAATPPPAAPVVTNTSGTP
ncbi:MAG: helix-turn-helix domain-containing protein [Sphingomonas sp.]